MRINEELLEGYENTKLIKYDTIDRNYQNTYYYNEIAKKNIKGVLKVNRYVDGKLLQTYSDDESHILTIAATRLGKTTQCVIPLIASFSEQKMKRSFCVSDPKCELYRLLAKNLKDKGYEVLLLNFRDYMHSELWNPLTPIYRAFKKIDELEKEVEVKKEGNKYYYLFRGVKYKDIEFLNSSITELKEAGMAEVDKMIVELAYGIIPPDKSHDQYWVDAPREWLCALLWSMLEDSTAERHNVIDEDNFTFDNLFKIMEGLTEAERYNDDDYFSDRGDKSKAYSYAKVVINNANNTRMCIISSFIAKMEAYRNSNIRLITSHNSFDMDVLTSDKPVAIFICYPDETKTYYKVISSFIKGAYTYLIDYANKQETGKLARPFYFILDEFGNFPKIADFDTVISACGGRNIWFDLVLQSYAQLDNVYDEKIAQIIRDNLNIHIFLGSNNPETLKAFSSECRRKTRVSPISALRGSREEIDSFELETIDLVPTSTLGNLKDGECIITEANSGYVLYSKMERYYKCEEFMNFEKKLESNYDTVFYNVRYQKKLKQKQAEQDEEGKLDIDEDFIICSVVRDYIKDKESFTPAELSFNLKISFEDIYDCIRIFLKAETINQIDENTYCYNKDNKKSIEDTLDDDDDYDDDDDDFDEEFRKVFHHNPFGFNYDEGGELREKILAEAHKISDEHNPLKKELNLMIPLYAYAELAQDAFETELEETIPCSVKTYFSQPELYTSEEDEFEEEIKFADCYSILANFLYHEQKTRLEVCHDICRSLINEEHILYDRVILKRLLYMLIIMTDKEFIKIKKYISE